MEVRLISVIVPVYKVEDYLDRCVESIVNQKYKNLEIILVDDGSPDNCPKMCDSWSEKDSRIVVVHKENGGLSDARNAGMKIARGEYIGFVDSDDWLEDNFFSVLAEQLDNGADIAECATRLCDEKDETILVRGFNEDKLLGKVVAVQTLLKEKGVMQTVWNKIYRKSIISDIAFEYGKCHEDNFWTWKVFMNADMVYVSNKPMYNYLQRNSSIMGSDYSLKRLDGLEAVFECFSVLKNDNNYRDIISRKFVTNSLYNLQCAIKLQNKADKKTAEKTILKYLKESGIKANDNALNSIWLRLFILFPKMTAIIRNMLGIGF